MNQIVSLFMFSCGDYEKVKQDVWKKTGKPCGCILLWRLLPLES